MHAAGKADVEFCGFQWSWMEHRQCPSTYSKQNKKPSSWCDINVHATSLTSDVLKPNPALAPVTRHTLPSRRRCITELSKDLLARSKPSRVKCFVPVHRNDKLRTSCIALRRVTRRQQALVEQLLCGCVDAIQGLKRDGSALTRMMTNDTNPSAKLF